MGWYILVIDKFDEKEDTRKIRRIAKWLRDRKAGYVRAVALLVWVEDEAAKKGALGSLRRMCSKAVLIRGFLPLPS